jgi:hypothetical protein
MKAERAFGGFSLISKHVFAGLAFTIVLGPVAFSASGAAAQTVDDLVARHIAARGGLAAIKAISSMRMTGTMRPGGFDVEVAYDETIARPGRVRIDATLQHLTIVQSYDGKDGWQIQPFQGRKDPEALSSDDTKSLQEEADFEGPLIDAKAKGATLESLGTVDIDGAPTYAIRANLKNGDQMTYYLDPTVMLTVRIETRQITRGAESLIDTDFGDYEKVNGVYFPFEIASGPKGATDPQRITYATMVANAPVDASIFARPAAPPSPPKSAGAKP